MLKPMTTYRSAPAKKGQENPQSGQMRTFIRGLENRIKLLEDTALRTLAELVEVNRRLATLTERG